MKKIYAILLCLICFGACNTDEMEEPEINIDYDTSIKILDRQQLSTHGNIRKELEKYEDHNKKNKSKKTEKSNDEFFINTERVKYIEQGGYHSYSF